MCFWGRVHATFSNIFTFCGVFSLKPPVIQFVDCGFRLFQPLATQFIVGALLKLAEIGSHQNQRAPLDIFGKGKLVQV